MDGATRRRRSSPAQTCAEKLVRAIASWVMLACVVAAGWEALRHIGAFDRRLLPSALEVVLALAELTCTSQFWEDLTSTLRRALGGLGIALLIGAPTGLLLSSVGFLRPIGVPVLDFFRSIPVTALYPIVVLTLGIGDRGKIGMVAFGCLLIIALHAAAGFERRSRIRHDVARLYGASRAQLLYRVTLPEAIPGILTGLRVSAGLAMIICILTEMFMGADRGLGQSLMEAYSIYKLPSMYAYVVALGIIGFVVNRFLFAVETKTQFWLTR